MSNSADLGPTTEEPPSLRAPPDARFTRWGLIKAICYMFCPPFPSCIVRKMAFHPPKRGEHYVLRTLKTNRYVSKASEIGDEPFILEPQQGSQQYLFRKNLLANYKAWVLKTSRRSKIIAIRARPMSPHNQKSSNLVVIFSQPNSADLGMFNYGMMANLQILANLLQVDVYSYDYSGFGYSSGTPGEANIYADIRAVYQHVRNEDPRKRIVLLGFSMGTAASVDMASENPDALAGVILVAAFTSGLRLMKKSPDDPKTSYCDRFTSIDKIGKVQAPILLMHGTKDDMISYEHTNALARACINAEKVFLIEGATHSSIFSAYHLETFAAMWMFVNTRLGITRESERQAVLERITVASVLNRVRIVFCEESIQRDNLESSKSES